MSDPQPAPQKFTFQQVFDMAFAAARDHRLDDAEKLYRALLQSRREPAVLLNLGRVLEDLGHLDEAEALFREVLAADPIPAFLLDMVEAGGLLPQLQRRFARS